jgi:hypothetical protein
MKFKQIILSFLFSLLLACSGANQETKNDSPLDKDQNNAIKSVVVQTDKLLDDMRARRVFSSNTRREQQILQQSMTIIKNSLVKIIAGNDTIGSFKTLYTYVKKLESISLIQTDSTLINTYKEDLYSITHKIAKALNINVDDFSWILYETRFSNLLPFTTTSTAGDWINDWSLGASHAKVRGYGNKAWLVSPLINLKNVEKAAFKIHHMIMVDDDSRSRIAFDRNKIIQNTYKAMVSTDYISGHPEEATWEEVKLSGFPTAVNFHAKWSDEIDISKFKGENVSIALLYDMNDKELGTHRVSWQINQFQVYGISDDFEVTDRPVKKYLYQDAFNKKNLGQNKSVATGENVQWTDYGRGGETEFAKLEASVPGIDTWLMTPKLSLKGEAPILKLKEVARNLDRPNFLVKISADYNGGDPTKSTWKTFEHIPADYSAEEGAWKNFNSLDMDISEFLGKDIVIAFQYKNIEGLHTAWEIDEVLIEGDGEEVKTTELSITYTNENEVPDIEGVDTIYSYNFTKGLDSLEIKKSAETSADFNFTERNGEGYIEIAGFKTKSEGSTQLISETIQLNSDDSYLKVNQAVNHYKPAGQKLNLIKILVAKLDDLSNTIEVQFEKKPLGSAWDKVESEWVLLPKELKESQIKIIFQYEGVKEENLYPSWNLFEFKIGEKK